VSAKQNDSTAKPATEATKPADPKASAAPRLEQKTLEVQNNPNIVKK
jgi:hypothetical protein